MSVKMKFRKSNTTAHVLHTQLVTDGRTRSGKPYTNEYMFTFRFEPGTGQILSIKEFMDSDYVKRMLAGEAEAA